MNIDQLTKLTDRIDRIEETIKNINQTINGYNIDKQYFVKSNNINPGVGTKVAYDSNGLVKSSEPLSQQDIPNLDMDKISGLKDAIDNKVSSADVKGIKNQLDTIYHHTDSVKTGTKVNVDSHGFVNDVSDLTPEDIPELSIDKISGLNDKLNQIEASIGNSNNMDSYSIAAGSGVKIQYNEKGQVTGSESLTIDDIPNELISQINRVEGEVSKRAYSDNVSKLARAVSEKIPYNDPIEPGTYSKVNVDKNGLVVKGDKLNKSDLPELGINDISGLNESLSDKATANQVVELNEELQQVRSMVENTNVSSNNDSKYLDRIHRLELKVSHIEDQVNNVLQNIPGDMILKQLDFIVYQLNTISGRVSVIEKKLNIDQG